MKRITLLKTILAASIALTSVMAMAGCSVGEDDHHDGFDQRDARQDQHPDDHQNNQQDNHQDDHQEDTPANH